MTKIFIDPPSGWRYGFPKSIPEQDYSSTNISDWLESNGYPKSEIEFALKHLRMWIESEVD